MCQFCCHIVADWDLGSTVFYSSFRFAMREIPEAWAGLTCTMTMSVVVGLDNTAILSTRHDNSIGRHEICTS